MTRAPLQFFMILIAALSAFTLPEAKSSVREAIQGLFAPVAYPARGIGRMISERLSPSHEADIVSPNAGRTVDELRKQNAELITRLFNLEAQLDDLKQLSAQYRQLGTGLRKMVEPASVIHGGASANQQTLTISTAGLSAISENMAVVQPLGVVGKIWSVATGGATARVLLVTDPHSHVQGRFVRIVQSGGVLRGVPVNTPPLVVDGNGQDMVIRYLAPRDVRGVVQVGDLVLLDDTSFPVPLKDLRLGTVRTIKLPTTDALHAEITVEPTADLSKLSEVLVVNK